MTHYASYLVRSWRAADGARRVVVEHIQSGMRVTVPTLDALVDRIAAWEEAGANRPGEHPTDGAEDDSTNETPATPRG